MKKILALLLCLLVTPLLSITGVGAQTKSYDSYEKKVAKTDVFTLKTLFQDKVVYIDWEKPTIMGEFKYYKIVRSTKNPSLVYPNDGYIGYIENDDILEYTDKNPAKGLVYYRVCLVTQEDNIYCSTVSKVDVKLEDENPIMCTMEYAPVCGKKDGIHVTYGNKCMMYGANATYVSTGECKVKNESSSDKNIQESKLSLSLKVKAQNTVKKFMTTLKQKGYSDEQKISTINTVIDKLHILTEAKPQLSDIIMYLIDLLKKEVDKMTDDFNEIEKIFNL